STWTTQWGPITSVRPLRALRSGDQGRVQCDSHGTFDTRRTVRTRRSRSIKRTQGPAADRAASQQGGCRTKHAQQSTKGKSPDSHREESSRQQVDKDRCTAEQRDELAPSYVEHGASPPLRALGASNDHQPATAPSPADRNYVEGGGANGAPGARGSSCRLVGR